eukprot:TRINITY_DN3197_c0_g1_i2.p1 TRINITY_DN3197_c0_g1~~TRINITY_DN3197_c0_g1_i2.p1  ORF type:complete len:133 (-),score=9.66 TRINITY_DN3197_c0_g1_i2:3-401(-)
MAISLSSWACAAIFLFGLSVCQTGSSVTMMNIDSLIPRMELFPLRSKIAILQHPANQTRSESINCATNLCSGYFDVCIEELNGHGFSCRGPIVEKELNEAAYIFNFSALVLCAVVSFMRILNMSDSTLFGEV